MQDERLSMVLQGMHDMLKAAQEQFLRAWPILRQSHGLGEAAHSVEAALQALEDSILVAVVAAWTKRVGPGLVLYEGGSPSKEPLFSKRGPSYDWPGMTQIRPDTGECVARLLRELRGHRHRDVVHVVVVDCIDGTTQLHNCVQNPAAHADAVVSTVVTVLEIPSGWDGRLTSIVTMTGMAQLMVPLDGEGGSFANVQGLHGSIRADQSRQSGTMPSTWARLICSDIPVTKDGASSAQWLYSGPEDGMLYDLYKCAQSMDAARAFASDLQASDPQAPDAQALGEQAPDAQEERSGPSLRVIDLARAASMGAGHESAQPARAHSAPLMIGAVRPTLVQMLQMLAQGSMAVRAPASLEQFDDLLAAVTVLAHVGVMVLIESGNGSVVSSVLSVPLCELVRAMLDEHAPVLLIAAPESRVERALASLR